MIILRKIKLLKSYCKTILIILTVQTILITGLQKAQAVSVSISPDCRPLQALQVQQFQATVTSATNNDVIWMVDGVKGGAPSIGTITANGLYTAPANMDEAVNVTISAVSAEDQTEQANIKVCNTAYSRSGTVHFVATTGNDSNTGSFSAPWRSIQHAVNQAQAGDTIAVRGGVYNETVMITKSGSAENGFITLSSYANEKAILDGSGLITERYGMRGLITINDASFIRIKGFEIRNYKSDTEFIAVGVLVQGSGQYIEIRNNIIHEIEANNLPANGAANALGIAVYGQEQSPIRHVIVDRNELYNLKTGTSESLTIGGNVDGWQVTKNQVHNNNFIGIDAAGYYNNNHNNLAEYNRARNGWIARNSVYNLSTAGNQALTYVATAIGIYVDGGQNITIEQNNSDANEGGIWLLSERPGKLTDYVTVRNNLVRFNRSAGILAGGYNATQSGGAAHISIANNTLYQNNGTNAAGINAGEFQIGHNVSDIKFINNILLAGAKGYVVTSFIPSVPDTVTLANNLYFTTSGAAFTRWFWNNTNYFNDGTSSNDFNAFTTISDDTDSLVADPLFTNANTGDLRPAAGSPALNSGRFAASTGFPVTGIKDYAMSPRIVDSKIDRGAYQHIGGPE